jgi:hypothetical protein
MVTKHKKAVWLRKVINGMRIILLMIEAYIAEMNYNSYVMVVMTGGEFTRAGKRGSKVSEVLRV